MSLSIGNKIFRNEQEQVAYLTELVQKLQIIIKDKEYSIKSIYQENGHLYFELNNEEIIDAGLIKAVVSIQKNAAGEIIVTYNDGTSGSLGTVKGLSYLELNASGHLIVHYDNNTIQDLGELLTGNLGVSGNISATGSITGSEILELMSGVSYDKSYRSAGYTFTNVYISAVKTGNKITFVESYNLVKNAGANPNLSLGRFMLPQEINDKLINQELGADTALDARDLNAYTGVTTSISVPAYIFKPAGWVGIQARVRTDNLVEGQKYFIRYETTFLLSANME